MRKKQKPTKPMTKGQRIAGSIIAIAILIITLVVVIQFLLPSLIPSLTSLLSPARGISGTWSGSVTMTDIGPPSCTYSGTAILVITQDGNTVSGTITIELKVISHPTSLPCDQLGPFTIPVTGTISSSRIDMVDSQQCSYTGMFTTDTMTLKVTTPPPAPCVPDPVTGICPKCVEYCGYTQTITLSRE